MNDKLKDVRGRKASEDDIVDYEETRNTKEPELEPDPSVVVATGDEQTPVSSSDPKEARKALYEKARKRREETVSRESEEYVDIAKLQAMQAEASGGERPESGIDTNRRDRFDEEGDEEAQAAAKLIDREQGEPETESTKKDSGSAADALTKRDPDAKVTVKILGKEYSVPQQDIDDAGGLEVYQKSRAATLRLQRIATLDRALPSQQEPAKAHGEQQEADPSTDGLDEADISSLREKLLDAMVDGEDLEAVDKVLEEALKSRRTTPKPQPKQEQHSEISATERQIIREAQQELAAQQEEDRRAANDMMRQEYSDIMGDPELLVLAQQRYAMIAAHGDNQGRTQKELARESAEYVRSLGKRLLVQPNQRNPIEDERRARIDRKKRLPQASRADAPAPAAPSQERKIPSRKEHLARLRRRAGLDLSE